LKGTFEQENIFIHSMPQPAARRLQDHRSPPDSSAPPSRPPFGGFPIWCTYGRYI
jgi:hypothetical protein